MTMVLPPQTKHVPHHLQAGATMYAHLILIPFNPVLQLCLHALVFSWCFYHVCNFHYNYSVVNISSHNTALYIYTALMHFIPSHKHFTQINSNSKQIGMASVHIYSLCVLIFISNVYFTAISQLHVVYTCN